MACFFVSADAYLHPLLPVHATREVRKALAVVANSGNLIAVARLYERMETIRSADVIAALHSNQPEDSAG